jgi:aspartyl-tRNA(Asn)/glutamyl-tRNA(Gln) amidotransferase subunit A
VEYLRHFQLSADPFRMDGGEKFDVDLPSQGDALARLDRAVRQGKGLVLLVGGVGSGKTRIARRLFEELEEEVFEAAMMVVLRREVDADWLLGEVGEATLPHAEYALSAYYLIAPSEASSNLARYDGVRYGLRVEGDDSIEMMFRTRGAGFGPEVKRRIMLGTYALSAGYYEAYYGQAQKVRTLILRDYAAAFERFDVLVSPTSPTTAFPIGAKADDPMAMYLNDIFTIPANLGGVPAISVPCGLDAKGLPIGLQLTARALDESTMFRAAAALESDLALELRPPLLAAA